MSTAKPALRNLMADKKPQSSQSKAFIEKARELGCDEDEQVFDRALKKVGAPTSKRSDVEKPSKKAKP